MSKPNKFERSYRDTPPPIDGVVRHISAKTPLSRTHGKVGMNCDFCGMPYETYACWAARTNAHYCSKACSNEAKKIPVRKNCVVCGSEFITNPTTAVRISTCSRKCLKQNRQAFLFAQAADMGNSPIFNYGNHERGEEIVGHKLDADKVLSIRADCRPQKLIAVDFSITQSLVSLIKRRLVWRHVAAEQI
ncbi:MAG: hypothetical protein HYS23_01085 [Geobacter sp.]|nr:hypothetical protein [Geobacter sp.]